MKIKLGTLLGVEPLLAEQVEKFGQWGDRCTYCGKGRPVVRVRLDDDEVQFCQTSWEEMGLGWQAEGWKVVQRR